MKFRQIINTSKILSKSFSVIFATGLVLQSPVFANGFLQNDVAYLQKGRIAYQSGQYDAAIRPLSDAIQANPNNADAFYWRALCFSSLNQGDRAIADLTSAIRVSNSTPAYYVSRGMLYANDKKYDLAISDFDAALQLDPYSSEAKTNRNYCASQLTKQTEIASHPAVPAKVDTTITQPVVTTTIATAKTSVSKKASTASSSKEESHALAELNAKFEQEREERKKTERELVEFKKEQERQLAELKKQDKKKEKVEIASNAASTQAVVVPATRKVSVETQVTQAVDKDKAAQVAINAVEQQAASRPVKDKWAVVVGISKFENPDLNLHYPSKDAEDFYKYLITKGNFAKDHVKLLMDEKATRQNILTLVGDKWLPYVALPDDLVVIYISSHGSSSEMDKEGVNYLLAYDSNVDTLYSSGLAMQDLTKAIKRRVHSDRVVMILDACHSGAVAPEAKGIERKGNINADSIAQGTGQLVISSSAPDQVSWESKNDENSVFTKYLMEGLGQKGDKTTLDDAFQFMKDKVQEEVLTERGVLQTPILRSVWKGGDLVLNAKPANPRQTFSFPLGTPGEADLSVHAMVMSASKSVGADAAKITGTTLKPAAKAKP